MNKIKKRIKEVFLNIKLPDFDDTNLKKRKGMVYVKEEKKKNNKKLFWALGTSLAFVICIFVGLGYFNNLRVASIVSIDVNPSILLTINKKEKVLDVTANNDDALVILEGMDLKGSDINVAVNALIGSMVKNGYIDELANSILISVDNPNSKESEALRERIVADLNGKFFNNEISVVSQNITSSTDKEKLAKEYGISLGKLELIEKLIEKNNLYTYESLKDLSINELNLLLGNTTADVVTSGTASDKAYIGESKALSIALDDANVKEVTWSEIEMDYDDGLMTYEVEFRVDSLEYEYEINAINGDILKGDREYDDDVVIEQKPTNNTSNSNNTTTSNDNNKETNSNNDSATDSTLNGYKSDANDLLKSINNLEIPKDYSKRRTLYYEWERKIEDLDHKLDNYDDQLESHYKRGQITASSYRRSEQLIDDIEDILERALDILEYRCDYDD